MTTLTWGGRSGSWSFPTFWRPLVAPGSLDIASFGATDFSTAAVGSAATVGGVVIAAGSHATIQIQDTLTVLGRFVAAGGTVELDQGSAIHGGTIDLTRADIIANGGLVDGAVWIGSLGRGVTVTAATLSLTEAARQGAALAVVGTLGLAGGSYDGMVLSLDAFGTSQGCELDVTNGDLVLFGQTTRVVLSQDDPSHMAGSNPGGGSPVLGGIGTLANQGLMISDALATTIDASSFINAGTIVLNDATVRGEQQVFLASGLLSWDATLAPSLILAGTQFENDGTITGAGATLAASGGSFVNTGLIALGDATARGPVLLPRPHIGDVALLSTLEIGADVAQFSNTGTLSADTIELAGSVSLADLGTLLGSVIFGGTLDLGGGTLDASTLAAGTTYVLTGTVARGTILDTNGRIDTHAATLDQVSIFTAQPTTLTDIQGPGTVLLSASTTELAYTAPLVVHGLTVMAGAPGLLDRIGVRGGTVTFGADTRISDTIAGTSLAIGGGVFVADGQIDLAGSDLEVQTLDGHGTITLSDNAVLTIDSIAPAASITIAFGHGTNALVLPSDISGLGTLGLTLTGLSTGDLLDFSGVSADPGTVFAEPGAGINGGQLQVQGASGDQASVATDANGLTFDAGTDPNGGTIVTVACFRHGTRLATPLGDRPVEALRIGDLVLTQSGAARPIRWLGRRAYPAALVRRQAQLRPVRIAAGALGAGLPRRSLDVSPLHAMLIDGVLVPAATLVNGRTITRAPIAATAYVHVELDRADILLAEGAPSESYVDCDNRAMFDNAAEFERLYPRSAHKRWHFPIPRLEEGWQVEAIRARLADAARPAAPGTMRGHIDRLAADRIEGWAMDTVHPSRPIELELLAGGRQLGCLVANRYRIDLDRAGHADGVCGFTAELPGLSAEALASVTLVRLADGARLTA